MPQKKLTATGVDALKTSKPQEDFYDALTPNLYLRVSGKTGRKTWLIRYRSNGTHQRMKLGTYPNLSLAKAREMARNELSRAEAGEDPAKEKKEAQERHERSTFEDLANEVLAAKARKTRESTQHERRRILDAELLPSWGQRPVSEISRRDVVQLVEGIANRGADTMANRTLAFIRLIFNEGLRRGFPTLESNPAHMVEPPGVEKGRDRYLTEHEIKAVWQATEDQPELTSGAFRLTLLTAQRIGSILAMRRADVQENGSGALWTIPSHVFKGKRPHLVPLSSEALEVLSATPEIAGSEEWVFPSREGAKRAHLTNLGKALTRVRKESKIPHWTAHDFRATFRTHATRAVEDCGLGIAGNVADAVLGHAENTLGWSRYQGDRDRYFLSEKRHALTAWGVFVRKAVGGPRGG